MANRWRKSTMDEPEFLEHLARVTTIGEVMKLYGIKYYSTVFELVQRGDICGTQTCNGNWLLSMDSVVAWYGKPELEETG